MLVLYFCSLVGNVLHLFTVDHNFSWYLSVGPRIIYDDILNFFIVVSTGSITNVHFSAFATIELKIF